MFKMFTLEEVYAYAEGLGYAKEEVEIVSEYGYDYDEEKELLLDYDVSFGHEGTEVWSWTFEDLSEPAIDYDHMVWED